MADSVAEIQKAKKLYTFIGLTLFIFTGITVAVATVPALDFGGHGFDVYDMVLGLVIAAFKASLVMLIFMHLNHEKKLVYFLFIMGIVLGVFLMAITAWAFSDPIEYGKGTTKENKSGFYDPSKPPQ
ncbi:MAG: cytochrome C oxidase subunit IV family protein [Roseibacillus sp.]